MSKTTLTEQYLRHETNMARRNLIRKTLSDSKPKTQDQKYMHAILIGILEIIEMKS